ncbi:cell division protein FtsX [bacterium BMS3Bbin12]|nr:cell division protein FtsX [bacterium BMS3Bbin12]GBE50275.1 cell division protein FtsX [bacterium BMS3Bbin13]HDJ86945.1 cell division protein FtsX [Chromatiales bacterium]
MRRRPRQASRQPVPRAAQPPPRGPRGAGRAGSRLRRPLTHLQRHAQVFLGSLGRLSRTPLTSLMTATVIGIALALPGGLYLLLHNAERLGGGWQESARISLYLKRDVGEKQARALAAQLRGRPGVRQVTYISREQGLREFRAASGFGAALDVLKTNPLPAVLVVQPAFSGDGPQAVQGLLEALRKLPQVALAQLDMAWVRRLYALMALAQRGVAILAAMLALAVLLVVGNTIRLDIQSRREQIEVTKLVGGTDAFIRRPFLYSGLWYGLAGGAIAWLLVRAALWLLQGPVQRLALLYHSDFTLTTLGLGPSVALLAGGGLLGLLGSWLAVGQHLAEIEPR